LLDGRINAFLRSANDKESVGLVERNYQEIGTDCRLMSEEVVSAIENWKDLVPEADVTTQVGIISNLKMELQCRGDELRDLKAEGESQKGKSSDELPRVKPDIARKEVQIRQLQEELVKRELGLSRLDSRVIKLASVVDGWSPEMLGLPNPPHIQVGAADFVVAPAPKIPS